MSVRRFALLCTISLGLSACGGSSLVRHAKPPPVTPALAQASDQGMAASLDWVIVRNGPGTWAKNADWDEYLIRVRNLGPTPVQVTGVAVYDSLGTRIVPAADRRRLIAGSKDSVRRYKGSHLKVKAGLGGGGLVAAGLGVSFGAAGSVAAGGGVLSAVAGATLFTMMAPGFGVAGIVRAVHNSQVNDEIKRRQSKLPVPIAGKGEQGLDVFFPLAPSPTRIEITYADSAGEHLLHLDTSVALAGLHLRPAAAMPSTPVAAPVAAPAAASARP
jgi:hypothetical protein